MAVINARNILTRLRDQPQPGPYVSSDQLLQRALQDFDAALWSWLASGARTADAVGLHELKVLGANVGEAVRLNAALDASTDRPFAWLPDPYHPVLSNHQGSGDKRGTEEQQPSNKQEESTIKTIVLR